ncbi:MAG TPA: hypothetical protein VLY23_14120, partial [Candidatus Acidoferrum sp.]|nr:hypothetical protein [Candidatus Acidoferrum sp.]
MPRYCEVAVPVPLRTTFTYAVPESLNGEPLIGRRVIVPFGKRAIVGVGLAESENPPNGARVKEIAELMDPLPALPPKLIELGHWISRYYVAPVGEAFRAMLPPEIELRQDRAYSITDAGRSCLRELAAAEERTDEERAEFELLCKFDNADSSVSSARLRRHPGVEALAGKLIRRGCLTASELLRRRKSRTQKIVAWKLGPVEARGFNPAESGPASSGVLTPEASAAEGLRDAQEDSILG